MSVNKYIKRHHHVTLSVGNGQEDYDFHTQVLGLKSVKKTALYDGDEPILHLYYGNDTGDVSRLITCFPMRHSGRKARKGSGQICTVCRSRHRSASGSGCWHSIIPAGSSTSWSALRGTRVSRIPTARCRRSTES